MAFTDIVRTVAVLDPSGYLAGAARIASASSSLHGQIDKALGSGGAGAVLAGLAGGIVATGAAFAAAAVAIGGSTLQAAAQMDSLERGLTAVMGSSQAAQAELAKLRDVAQLPGLGFREAIEGSVRLQAAGLSAQQAREALMAFGNALATVGKGKDALGLVELALSQIATKSKLEGQDLRQLQEQVPQIRKAMQAAFGTADTQELAKSGVSSQQFITGIIRELNKLPRVTGGIQNAFENVSDAAFRARAAFGKGFFDALGPAFEGLTDKINRLAQNGALERWGRVTGTVLRGLVELIPLVGAGLAAWGAVEVVGGIQAVVTAVKGMRTALQGVALMEVITEALAGNWVQIAAGAAAAVAAFAGVEALTRQLDSGAKSAPAPSADGATATPPGNRPTLVGSSPWDAETAHNTAKTAEYTRQSAESLRHVIGADRATRGVTPIEVRGIIGAGRPARGPQIVRLIGTGPDEADRMQNLLAELMRMGVIAPGPAYG